MTVYAPDADVFIDIRRSGHTEQFKNLGRLPLVVTDVVWGELTVNAAKNGAISSTVAEMESLLVAVAGEPTEIRPDTDEITTLATLSIPPSEDPGELSIIAYAYHHPSVIPVLLDRRALRRAVEELRRMMLSLHGFLAVLRDQHGLARAIADDISHWFCTRNQPVCAPLWW